jgi:hypothetical protein
MNGTANKELSINLITPEFFTEKFGQDGYLVCSGQKTLDRPKSKNDNLKLDILHLTTDNKWADLIVWS